MYLKSFSIPTFLFLLISISSWGQNIPFKNFNSENHLPSNETYQLHEDREGFIWICTDRGVVRFDGQNFKHFSTLNGLNNNTVFHAISDYKGRTWFTTMENGLCYHYKHKIYKHPLSDQLKEKFGTHSRLPYLAIDQDGGISISSQHRLEWTNNDYYYIPPDEQELITKSVDISFAVDSPINPQIFILKEDQQHLLIGLQHHIGLTTNFNYSDNPLVYQQKKNVVYTGLQGYYGLLPLKNKHLLFFNPQKLILINPDTKKIIRTAALDSASIIKIYEDPDQNLWLSTTNGIYYYPEGNLSHPPKILFKGYYITSILVPSDGSLWVSTHKNGVFWIANKQTYNFFKSEKPNKNSFIKLFKYANKNYAAAQNGSIYQLSFPPVKKTNSLQPFISDLLLYNDSLLLCSQGSIFKLPNFVEHQLNKSISMNSGHVKNIYQSSNRDIWVAASRGIYSFRRDSLYETPFKIRSNAIFEYKTPQELLIGSNEGLYLYNTTNKSFHSLGNRDSLLQERIASIARLSSSYFLLGTIGAGLLILDQDLNVIQQLSPKNGLISSFIKKVYVENDSIIWVASNNGCNRIQFNKNLSIKQINSFASNTILPSSSVNDIIVDSNSVWIATENGLAYFNNANSSYSSSLIPKAYLLSSKANGKAFLHQAILGYQQDHLEFEFSSINFSNQGSKYCYRLIGLDTFWSFTNKKSIHYANLPPGDYEFQVSVKLNSGGFSRQIDRILFSIEPHYTQTYWFKALFFLFFAIIILFSIRLKMKQNHLEKLKIQAEQKALHSQIKPHFIFNAMNSILFFIERNNKKTASLYLSSFSKLLRKILENSQHDLVLISKEFDALREYLKLERLRMEEHNTGYQHDFCIAAIPPSFSRYKIPPMLIQSLVENSILHGLATKKGNRKIDITIDAIDNNMLLSIIDNGIGRVASQKINAKRVHHQSTGIKNTILRLKTLSLIYKKNFSLDIIDLEEGTKVVLTIPQLS